MSQPPVPPQPPTATRGEIWLDYAWLAASLFFGAVLVANFTLMDPVDAVMYGVGSLLGAFMFSFRRQQRKRRHAAAHSVPETDPVGYPPQAPKA